MSEIGEAIGINGLVALIILLAFGVLSLSLMLVYVGRRGEFFARLARLRGIKINETLRVIRLAEQISDIGVWQYSPKTGRQQWSNGMRRLFGLDPSEKFCEGDAETLLYANGVELVQDVNEFAGRKRAFEIEYGIHGFDGLPRSLKVRVKNLYSDDGRLDRVVAVLRDVTEESRERRALETSHERAIREAEKAKRLAETDALTGLANRRRVMAELDQRVLDAQFANQPLSLILFDIDRFKRVNDTFGHPAGDEILKVVAGLAQAQARTNDLIGRVGGEEFVWIVPGADATMSRILAERLRQTVGASSRTSAVQNGVTISVGFASMEHKDAGLSLFARADSALYQAKNSGRNRVRMAA